MRAASVGPSKLHGKNPLLRPHAGRRRPIFGAAVKSSKDHSLPADQTGQSRRDIMQKSSAALLAVLLLRDGKAIADESTLIQTTEPTQEAAAKIDAASDLDLITVQDVDWEFQVPSNWKEIRTDQPIKKYERGPAPERSPLRARFDSPDGSTILSVVVRPSQVIKPTLFQVNDVSDFGELKEAAQLLLPPGARVITKSSISIPQPPKETPLGQVEIPPRNYYTYEFLTTNGLRVVLTAAAARGKVYVCGASAPQDKFSIAQDASRQAVMTFRLP